MQQLITKHKNRHKVFQVLPMYNMHPYFSLKNLGKRSVPYMWQNMVNSLVYTWAPNLDAPY